MRPVAADPERTLTELLEELAAIDDERHRADVRDQIIVKLNRRRTKFSVQARAEAQLTAGESPEETLQRFRSGAPSKLAGCVRARPGIGPALDWAASVGTPPCPP